MADVRSLLRSELASRGQPKGKNRPAKTSTATGPPPTSLNKKRKAADDGDEGRKRARAAPMNGFLPEGFFGEDTDAAAAAVEPNAEVAPAVGAPIEDTSSPPDVPMLPPPPPDNQPAVTVEVDEDEWAAFERDIAVPLPEPPAIAAYSAAATIQAAPMSAEELAAQAREGQAEHRGRREAELEAEKEDAARHLEEEFDEMEALEARARRLRERREQLRRASLSTAEVVPTAETSTKPSPREAELDDGEEEEDEDDVDEWAFGAR